MFAADVYVLFAVFLFCLPFSVQLTLCVCICVTGCFHFGLPAIERAFEMCVRVYVDTVRAVLQRTFYTRFRIMYSLFSQRESARMCLGTCALPRDGERYRDDVSWRPQMIGLWDLFVIVSVWRILADMAGSLIVRHR